MGWMWAAHGDGVWTGIQHGAELGRRLCEAAKRSSRIWDRWSVVFVETPVTPRHDRNDPREGPAVPAHQPPRRWTHTAAMTTSGEEASGKKLVKKSIGCRRPLGAKEHNPNFHCGVEVVWDHAKDGGHVVFQVASQDHSEDSPWSTFLDLEQLRKSLRSGGTPSKLGLWSPGKVWRRWGRPWKLRVELRKAKDG